MRDGDGKQKQKAKIDGGDLAPAGDQRTHEDGPGSYGRIPVKKDTAKPGRVCWIFEANLQQTLFDSSLNEVCPELVVPRDKGLDVRQN